MQCFKCQEAESARGLSSPGPLWIPLLELPAQAQFLD